MADLSSATELYRELEVAWSAKSIEQVGDILSKLKLVLLNLSFLPTGGNLAELDERLLLIARSMLEIGAFWSLEKKDVASFERYVAQLKCYYFDYAENLTNSDYMYPILGLNLMRLLAQNRLSEFHTELELFPPDQLSNIYLKKPVTLEQFVMEGNYYKVFLSKEDIPYPYYAMFVESLIHTIRDEIAICMEKAFSKILIVEAAKMLRTSSDEELSSYVRSRGWPVDSSFHYFVFEAEEKGKDEIVRSPTIIAQCLGYVRELEKIV